MGGNTSKNLDGGCKCSKIMLWDEGWKCLVATALLSFLTTVTMCTLGAHGVIKMPMDLMVPIFAAQVSVPVALGVFWGSQNSGPIWCKLLRTVSFAGAIFLALWGACHPTNAGHSVSTIHQVIQDVGAYTFGIAAFTVPINDSLKEESNEQSPRPRAGSAPASTKPRSRVIKEKAAGRIRFKSAPPRSKPRWCPHCDGGTLDENGWCSKFYCPENAYKNPDVKSDNISELERLLVEAKQRVRLPSVAEPVTGSPDGPHVPRKKQGARATHRHWIHIDSDEWK